MRSKHEQILTLTNQLIDFGAERLQRRHRATDSSAAIVESLAMLQEFYAVHETAVRRRAEQIRKSGEIERLLDGADNG